MGINLSDLFQKEQFHNTVKSTMPSEAEIASTKNAGSNATDYMKLQPGQQFKGTVVGMEGDRVSILTEDQVVFSAKLENGMHIQNGMTLSFEVKGIQGNQISLTPLYSNLTQASSVMKALQAAELPVTANSIRMVNEMMSQGMGIDKMSLQNMFHLLGQYEQADPVTLVQMRQMELPISSDHIVMFENYKSNTAQMIAGYSEIGKQMMSVLQDMAGQKDFEGLGKLFTEIMKCVSSEVLNSSVTNASTGVLQRQGAATADGQVFVQERETMMSGKDTMTEHVVQAKGIVTGGEKAVVTGGVTSVLGKNATLQNAQETADIHGAMRQETETSAGQTRLLAADIELSPVDNKVVGERNGTEQLTALDIIHSESGLQLQEFVDGMLPRLSGLSQIEQSMLYREVGKALSHLMHDPAFENEFQKALTREWLLAPQEVSDKEQVKALYEKVLKQTASLEQLLVQAGKADTVAVKNLQEMARNVEFLNELNQNFAYVQLPLKMSEQNAHGDLYVYTNKRNMAAGDGAVTAMLHLAMEHLGTMDIYVAMQNQKVSTKFYLESDEIIDFMEGHMNELNSRLTQKGYSMKAQLLPLDHKDTGNVFDEMLVDSHGIGKTPMVMINRQSFDARA